MKTQYLVLIMLVEALTGCGAGTNEQVANNSNPAVTVPPPVIVCAVNGVVVPCGK